MRTAEQVTFGGGGIDRAAFRRCEASEQARLLADPRARVLPLWRGKPQVAGETPLALAPVAPGHACLAHATMAPVFLGLDGETPWFAADISGWEPEDVDTATLGAFLDPSEQRFPGAPDNARFAELRRIMTQLSPIHAELAATARALIEWHRAHRFCARCGAESAPAQAGWQRDCPACGASHFPRTDPVVIMLITHGNSVLMGRSPQWPEGMYSLLAGFVEPGETVEAAVRREVFEEAGVRVGPVSYLASQPWPFPASLMLGCHSRALGREITIDPKEIEDARWMSREEMLAAQAGDLPGLLPARPGAIARFLLDNWLADRLE
ncbi:NAD(+) diphosphatase [Tropicimonas sp. IMCC6043]|uniref:NAD(+) diphosphatase n=1 Tax=Tropicimonas sp. IMCC6043 TaxID=2510645 RepID=UPI00101DEC53|nr:NAD(+) diphosphatase [Tropicimonas sp. IMCC6043]RYH07405.1 NAD(+) diphosphatase [Tropicimonas sp. IMCC6043]